MATLSERDVRRRHRVVALPNEIPCVQTKLLALAGQMAVGIRVSGSITHALFFLLFLAALAKCRTRAYIKWAPPCLGFVIIN